VNQTKPLETFALEDRLAEQWRRRLRCFQMFQETSKTQEIGEAGVHTRMRARDKSIVITVEICFCRPHWAGHKYVLKPIPS